MKRTLITLAMITSSQIALAGNFSGLNLNKVFNTSEVKEVASCIDISGTWRGSCEEEGETTMVIEQVGCDVFVVDGDRYQVGSTKTETQTDDSFTTSTSTTLNWNEDQTALLIDLKLLSDSIDDGRVQYSTDIAGTGNYHLENGKLISTYDLSGKITSADHPELNSDFESHDTCTLERI